MAAPRPTMVPANCLRRLKLFSVSQRPISRNISTTASLLADEPTTPRKPYNGPFHDLRNADDLPPQNDPQSHIQRALVALAKEHGVPFPPSLQEPACDPRLPRSVQALYLQPLRRKPTHGLPVANLQLRSYSVRNLEFMADFALRAAYYLGLPAKGPVPLPRITERWTVLRDVFIHKKSQENWERITTRRLIQIQDGDPEVVQRWLAFLRKWTWYGVGMKANVWEHEDMDVVKRMDNNPEAVKAGLESVNWDLLGRRRGLSNAEEMRKFMDRQGFSAGAGARGSKKATDKA